MMAATVDTTEYTTKCAVAQIPESFQDRYKIICKLGAEMAAYAARADAAKTREARDNWRTLADEVWGRMEAQAVAFFGLTDTERADFNAMVGFNFDPATSIERIIQARDSKDYNRTINAVLWGGY
jgi:hypothetical protein